MKISIPNNPRNEQTFFENSDSIKYLDGDKSEVQNEDESKANGQDESISGMLDIELMMTSRKCFILFQMFFSVFQCKVAKQNQVFHKCKPNSSQILGCEFMEKQNSIERLNSSLSSGKSQYQKKSLHIQTCYKIDK